MFSSLPFRFSYSPHKKPELTISRSPNPPFSDSIFLGYQNSTSFFLLQGANITMNGGGTIDGNGQIWWLVFSLPSSSCQNLTDFPSLEC
jgi:hypothetical protein